MIRIFNIILFILILAISFCLKETYFHQGVRFSSTKTEYVYYDGEKEIDENGGIIIEFDDGDDFSIHHNTIHNAVDRDVGVSLRMNVANEWGGGLGDDR